MLRRHRFGVPALLVASVYLAVVVVAAVLAPATGGLGALWRVTLFTEAGEGAAVTWPNVLVPCAVGLAWAWALWQSLRGPLAGPPPEPDRDVQRLRAGLYTAAAVSCLYAVLPWWPWSAVVLDAAVMGAVAVLSQPVLRRDLVHVDRMRAAGVAGYAGTAAFEVLDVIGRPVPDVLSLVCAVATLIWIVLFLRVQWRDDRWRRATVRYGIAALVAPLAFIFIPMGMSLPIAEDLYVGAAGAFGALSLVWLARSAHDLADPRRQPAPPAPLSAQPQS
ncbi:hypothetical protein [Planomonospora parontospora]|uniref:hypothetical protein n=1 Tax=Planomonospora parontospora TaxID=58119 RepID=UPI001670A722|nr:hypothetical protein [Planomonospora parontospora]GGL58347.1 hypothetical protein GCM10014719_69680 [Planomonospora parontospora subsp. antibiotica]GII20146.1 hypothetical protein Ppa05_68720 [Planomonospora parontospora subsp. antibiotica]